MFLMKGHGTIVVNSGDKSDYRTEKTMSAEAACGYTKGSYPGTPIFGHFDYLFPEADPLPERQDMTGLLDALAEATIQHAPEEKENSSIPPVFTYMGQFIDHDITANTDRENGISVIDVDKVEPISRPAIVKGLGNLRFASLNLDSLYGDAPNQGEISKMLQKAMRWEKDRAKLEGGLDNDGTHFPKFDSAAFNNHKRAEFPKDANRDLLRAGHASTESGFDVSLLAKGPKDITDLFFIDGKLNPFRAIIGDARNDENLAVAQFHLAMQRLHNEIVDAAPASIAHDREAVFQWAQKHTRWIYQWLVVHAYLPAVCKAEVLQDVLKNGPTLYNHFFKRTGDKYGPFDPDLMPMPLEFSVAAFRFGHSMAREAYDWNRVFGRGPSPAIPEASFGLLFAFTGNGMPALGTDGITGKKLNRLPGSWPIAWDRFVHPPVSGLENRSARRIDTHLSLVFKKMPNEPQKSSDIMKHLAKRNLRRGYRLNVPTAQGCLDTLAAKGINLPRLSEAKLLEGHTGAAVRAGGFEKRTPLWFYVLKEAEMEADGNTLGSLGSLLVADTLFGLIMNGDDSYYKAAPGGEQWKPQDSVTPNGIKITDMPSMMAAAGLL